MIRLCGLNSISLTQVYDKNSIKDENSKKKLSENAYYSETRIKTLENINRNKCNNKHIRITNYYPNYSAIEKYYLLI
jgi:hypothetical protein